MTVNSNVHTILIPWLAKISQCLNLAKKKIKKDLDIFVSFNS